MCLGRGFTWALVKIGNRAGPVTRLPGSLPANGGGPRGPFPLDSHAISLRPIRRGATLNCERRAAIDTAQKNGAIHASKQIENRAQSHTHAWMACMARTGRLSYLYAKHAIFASARRRRQRQSGF